MAKVLNLCAKNIPGTNFPGAPSGRKDPCWCYFLWLVVVCCRPQCCWPWKSWCVKSMVMDPFTSLPGAMHTIDCGAFLRAGFPRLFLELIWWVSAEDSGSNLQTTRIADCRANTSCFCGLEYMCMLWLKRRLDGRGFVWWLELRLVIHDVRGAVRKRKMGSETIFSELHAAQQIQNIRSKTLCIGIIDPAEDILQRKKHGG